MGCGHAASAGLETRCNSGAITMSVTMDSAETAQQPRNGAAIESPVFHSVGVYITIEHRGEERGKR
jgi:hypothetical protein